MAVGLSSPVRFSKHWVKASSEGVVEGESLRIVGVIRWCPPEHGWVKMNSNGASRGLLPPASCGGILRDWNGRWILGFAKKLAPYYALEAELWGFFTGLQQRWRLRICKVIVEVDSLTVCRKIQNEEHQMGDGSRLLQTMVGQRLANLCFSHCQRG